MCVSVCTCLSVLRGERESVCVCARARVSVGIQPHFGPSHLLSAEHAGSEPLNSANLDRLTSENEAGVAVASSR